MSEDLQEEPAVPSRVRQLVLVGDGEVGRTKGTDAQRTTTRAARSAECEPAR